MPWVEKRENGYRLVVDLGVDHLGKRKRKTKIVDTRNKKQAEKELARFIVELEEKGYTLASSSAKVTFGQALDKWVQLFVEKELEHTTETNYKRQLNARIRPALGNLQLEKITTLTITQFLHDLKNLKRPNEPAGAETKIYIYRMLKSIFTKLGEWYNLDKNPMDKVVRPKNDNSPEINVYDEKESNAVLRLLEHQSTQFRLFISLAFTSGMRKGELIGLEWKHIKMDQALVEIRQSIPAYKDGLPVIKAPKTKKSVRTVSIPPSMVEELREYQKEWFKLRTKNIDVWWQAEREFLFCDNAGMPVRPSTTGDRWRKFTKRNKIRHIRLQDIRHTSVTILINRGIHAKIISERVGHSNINTTMNVYGHVIRAADAAAASIFEDVFTPPPPPKKAVSGGKKGGKQ